jgi:hypothetical protein
MTVLVSLIVMLVLQIFLYLLGVAAIAAYFYSLVGAIALYVLVEWRRTRSGS